MQFTVVSVVDSEHLRELEVSLPTWLRFRPEFRFAQFLLIADAATVSPEELSTVRSLVPHARIEWIEPPRHWPQRERMLSAFVQLAPHFVYTPYFLKIDTDCLAIAPSQWIEPWWFEHDPVYVSSPWGYTKPADAIERLDIWGDSIEALKRFPRLNLPYNPASNKIAHRRIISWLYFGRTNWHREIASWVGGKCTDRMPIPSQDTFCWYCAERTKAFSRTVQLRKYGWRHVNGLEKLKQQAAVVMAGGLAA